MVGRGKNCTIWIMAVMLALAGAALVIPAGITPAAAQTAAGALSEAQDVNGRPGVVAEIVQCKRENGVLSIRMRLRNTGDKDTSVQLIDMRNYDHYYVTAGNKKYFVLRDSEKAPLASPSSSGGNLGATVPKAGSYVWYAKYPAPPAEVKKVTYYTPVTPPFEDIPISD